MISLFAYLTWSGQQEAIHGAGTTTRNYAAIIEARLSATLRRADADLQELVLTIPAEAMSRQSVPRYGRGINAILESRLTKFPELAGLRIYDAASDRLYVTDAATTPSTHIADRAYFRQLRDNPQAGLVFSEVIISRTNGRPTVPVARAIRDGQGAFRGIVSVTLELDYFQKLFQTLDLGAGGVIAIYRSDDPRLVVRWPPADGALNRQLPAGNPAYPLLAQGGKTATIEFAASTDGVVRIYSFNVLERYPFFVTAALAREDVLADWQQRSLLVALCGLLLAGLLAVLLYRLSRAEDSIKANAQLMRSTFEQAAVGIAHISLGTYRILIANDRFCNLLGYTQEELIGTDSRALSPDDEIPAREAERAQVLAGRVRVSACERCLLRKGGASLWVNRNLSLVRDAAGQPLYFITVIEDISVRKQTEQARAHLAAIVSSTNEAIIGRGLDYKILSWNPAAERLFGYTADEVIGRDVALLVPPECEEEVRRNHELVAQGRTLLDVDSVRLAKNGRRIDVGLSLASVYDERGITLGAVLMFRDISVRLRKTALLQLLESLARETNEATTPEVAMQTCLERICAYGNWTLGHVALYAPGRSAGIVPTSFWCCEDRARFGEFIDYSNTVSHNEPGGQFVGMAMRERRAVWVADLSQVPSFGRLKEVVRVGIRAGLVFPISVHGEVTCFLEFFATEARPPDESLLDAINSVASQLAQLIERSRAQAALGRLNVELEMRVVERTAELEAVNQELSDFSYTIAHDLRAPVRAMNGFSAIVLKANEDKLEPESVGHLRRVLAASERMGRLIDDLLNLARLSRQEIKGQDFNLSVIAANVVAAIGEAHPQRNVPVTIQPDMHASGDPGLIRVVLDNLIGNAWKFTAKTETATIDIGSERQDGRTVYHIRDNGAGFDMQYVNKLFAPFQRLHHADEFEGTGIGLATVRKIIGRHGGKIWLEGAVNRGAAVFFTLG